MVYQIMDNEAVLVDSQQKLLTWAAERRIFISILEKNFDGLNANPGVATM